MITSEPVVAYLPEVAFPPYYSNRPLELEATQTADTIREARMSDRTDWIRNLSTEELLFLHKVYDIINQSTCWTIESQRAAGEIRQELARIGQLVGLNDGSKSRFDE